MTCSFSFLRLWNYLNIYFLKPFDAVNDTITSDLLLKFNWEKNYVELGSGDGMFSYIMHGNSFPIWFDRYLNVDLNSKNIFKSKNKIIFPNLKKKKFIIAPKLSIDARLHHIELVKKIKFSKFAKKMNYENLGLTKNSEKLIFFYTPHGLKNYNISLNKAVTGLKKRGKIILLLYLNNVKDNFIFYKLRNKTIGVLKKFFTKMDNGRYNETNKISKNFKSWAKLFKKNNLVISDYYTGLSPFAWKIYDIQTRPVLKYLIRFFSILPLPIRTICKISWMAAFYPILCLIYLLCSNIRQGYLNKNSYIVFQLKKI